MLMLISENLQIIGVFFYFSHAVNNIGNGKFEEFTKLTDLCKGTIGFQFNYNFYEQVEGTVMRWSLWYFYRHL